MIKKSICFFILILLSINVINSLELSTSPGNLEFKGKTNEKICNEFQIHSDYNKSILSELIWNNNPKTKNNINEYKLTSSQLDIKEEIEKNIILKEQSIKKQICLTFKEPGTYNGALIFKTQDSYAAVGIWINAKISGAKTNNPNKETQTITGLSIYNPVNNTNKNNNNLIFLSIITTVVLLTILFTLMFVRKIR